MKNLTINIITDSDIIGSGIASIINSLNFSSTTVHIGRLDEQQIQQEKPFIVFIDAVSMSTAEIKQFRQEIPSKASVIGVYHSALPAENVASFDSMISVYADRATIKALIENAINQNNDDEDNTDELTPREKEIVVGVVKGLSNKEIANHLNVSVNTVMTHRRNIAAKLQIHSPAGLTIYAIVSKLISIDEIKAGVL